MSNYRIPIKQLTFARWNNLLIEIQAERKEKMTHDEFANFLMENSKNSINTTNAKIIVECIKITLNVFTSNKHFDSENMQNLESAIKRLDQIIPDEKILEYPSIQYFFKLLTEEATATEVKN